MARSFDTMMESATHSTMTMAVAADRPPNKEKSAMSEACSDSGKASTVISRSSAPSEKVSKPATASGMTKMLIATR